MVILFYTQVSNVARNKTFNSFTKLLESNLKSFTLLLSKNSQIIIYNGKKIFFAEKKLNPSVFHISKKIKKESEHFLSECLLYRERKDRHIIRYYHYSIMPYTLSRFYYVDIKSAYVTTLNKREVISNALLLKINELPKQDRLISLGMLAYEPYEIKYIEGIKQPVQRIRNLYSPVFYTACSDTQKLMEKIIELINGEFIFYWVDGIFFKDIKHYYLIKDYLNSIQYKFSFGSCCGLISEKKDNYWNLKFYQSEIKNGKHQFKLKNYSIPEYFQDFEERKINHNLIMEGKFDILADNYRKQINKTKNNY